MSGIFLPLWGAIAGKQSQPDPEELPSLSLWYNASASSTIVNGVSIQNFNTAVVNGTDISNWNDLSGLGHASNVTGGGARQPAYAIPVQNNLGMVQYTAANEDNLDINPIAWSQSLPGFSIYVLARPTSYAALFPLVVTDNNLGIKFDGTYMTVGAAGATGQAQSYTPTVNTHIFGMIFDGTQIDNSTRLKFRIDSTPQILTFSGPVGTSTSASSSYFFFGGENRPSASLGFMNGYIGEVLIWNRALNLSEQLGVESYLKSKWAA